MGVGAAAASSEGTPKAGVPSVIGRDLTQEAPRVERVPSNDPYLSPEAVLSNSSVYRPALPRVKDAIESSGASLATLDEESPWAKKKILCLDGGGIRSLSSLLILQQLMDSVRELERKEEPPALASSDSPLIERGRAKAKTARFPSQTENHGEYLPCHYFDYIGGTSSGGLIAILLGRLRMSVDAVFDEYVKICKEGLGNSRPVHLSSLMRRLKRPSFRTRFDSGISALKPSQSSPDEGDQIFESDVVRCRTVVCAIQNGTNKGFSVPCLYRSYPNPTGIKGSNQLTTLNILSVVHATVAAPTLYKSLDLNASLNNPSFEVYGEVLRMHHRFGNPVDLILSLGCGSPKSQSSQARKTREPGKGNIAPSKLERQLRTVSDGVDKIMEWESHYSSFDYYRLDVKQHLSTVSVNEWKPRASGEDTIARIKTAAAAYLRDPIVRDSIDRCAAALVKTRRARCQTMRWETFALGTRYRCKFLSPAPCDLKDARGRPVIFQTRNELMDHLRTYHHEHAPDANNYQKIKSLMDSGRTDSDLSNSSQDS